MSYSGLIYFRRPENKSKLNWKKKWTSISSLPSSWEICEKDWLICFFYVVSTLCGLFKQPFTTWISDCMRLFTVLCVVKWSPIYLLTGFNTPVIEGEPVCETRRWQSSLERWNTNPKNLGKIEENGTRYVCVWGGGPDNNLNENN